MLQEKALNTSQQLARNVVETSFRSFDQKAVQKAKWRILDAVGCAAVGVRAAGTAILRDIVKDWGGKEESTILVYGGRVPAHNAAMLNSLMTRSFDFEPVEAEGEYKSSPAHISGTTVPTALALAERTAASGRDLITALLVGDDLACRLGVASGFDFSLGWDNTGTINRFGATAIAAKLLQLDEKQTFNAFGIALNQLSGSMAGVFDKTLTFKLPIALASRDGIFAAELAGRGFSGVKEPFLGPRGFFALFCRNASTADLVKDIGQRYYADCVIKPYSACRATHPFIDCALELARHPDCKITDIEKIVIHATPGTIAGFCGQPFNPGATPQVDGAFSIRYTVATALLRQNVKPEYFEDQYIHDPRVSGLIEKMEFESDIPKEKITGTELTVQMKSGKKITARTDFPRGDFRRTPLTEEEIQAKYRSNMAYSGLIGPAKSEQALGLIANLENLADVRELTACLVKE